MKREHILLALIFFLTFGARLFFAFSTENFTYDSYFNLRQVENIRQNGLPIFNDELSYGGRFFIFTPLYHYVLAFFDLFLPLDFVVKVIPNLLASFIVIVVYLVSMNITNNKEAAVFSSFISGFIPIFFAETTNSIHVFTLMLPLSFLLIYFFIRIKDDKKYLTYFIITLVVSSLVHPSSFLIVLGLVIYASIGKLEHLRIQRKELELIVFSTLLVVLINFFIYQRALITHGASILSQNIPSYFPGSLLEMIYKTGLIPFIAGLSVIYRSFFKSRNKYIFLLIGFAISSALALWLKLINFISGLMFLSVILVLLFSCFYVFFFEYVKKTRFSGFKIYFVMLATLIFIVTSVIPSLYYNYTGLQNIPSEDETSAMKWLQENTMDNAVILAPVKEGFMINQIAKRKNVLDSNFLLARDVSQRLEDVETIYTTQFKTIAIELLNKYDVDYIYLSDRVRTEHATSELRYFDRTCFDVVYDNGVRIYKSLCKLR